MGAVWDLRTNEYVHFETDEEKNGWLGKNFGRKKEFSLKNKEAAGKSSPSNNRNAPQNTIYQCLDGAIVIEEDGRNPKKLTIEKALLEFKDSPTVKLEDMTLGMVELFMSHPAGIETMMGISPMCPARNIAFDRDSPRSYSLIALVAMAASWMLAQIETSRPKGTSGPKDSLSELMYQIALIKGDGQIFPYE